MMEGKRVRFAFATKSEAETKATLVRTQRKMDGIRGFTAATRYDQADAEEAYRILSPHGFTMREAARFYVENLNLIHEPKTVAWVTAELLKLKTQDGRSPRYIKDLRFKLENAFASEFGDRSIHEITHQELDDWLRSHPLVRCYPE